MAFKKLKLPSILIFVILLGCKTVSLQTSQTKTTQQIPLGSIGTNKDFLLQQHYNNTAIPNYQNLIKLAVSIKPFTKQSFKAFEKAKTLQVANVNIVNVDSFPNKPYYLELHIADKVGVINALNAEGNTGIKEYLSHDPRTNVVMVISLALNNTDLETIKTAEAVFLVEHSPKTYALKWYKDKTNTGIIPFNAGVMFEYQTAHCCWDENNRRQLHIVDLVTTFNSCPNGTYRSANRAKKNSNDFKI